MKKLTTIEILNKIDKRVEHLQKLDEIRAERQKLNSSHYIQKMKDEEKTNGENK